MPVQGRSRLFLMIAALAGLSVLASAATQQPDERLAVRITSPLGRTGVPGTIRIVAQVQHAPDIRLQPIRFLVNDVPIGEVAEGPPWAIEWTDDNPFEPRRITVVAQTDTGEVVSDSVDLKPLEIVEETRVSSVVLEATVLNRDGRYVTGMGPTAFTLLENDVKQTLDVVKPETMPATYTLLIDSSQSMARRMDFVRDAAGRIDGFLRPQDRIIVAPFSKGLGPITGPTDDRRTVAEAISAIQAKGGTAIADALEETAEMISAIEGRHAVILLSDGYDEHSTRPIQEAMEAVQHTGATVYVIGIGGIAGISLRGERELRKLAVETGGRVFFPSRETELPSVHELVASDVARRYIITYTPINQTADGSWRKITLETADPTYTVRTRPGYFAPAPAPIRPSIEFTIHDTDGQLHAIAREDLVVLEDGVEQTVDTFQEAVAPLSIILAVDESGSMRPSTEQVREAARTFVESLRPQDNLALIIFSNRALFAHDLATERSWSFDAIARYQPTGGTALFDATADAIIRLKRATGRKVVVVMTDGRDENAAGTGPGSVRDFDVVSTLLKSTDDVTVFSIGLGPNVDRDVLERLAKESGGAAYFPQDVSNLKDDYLRITENLRRRYVILYTSTNTTRDGAWRPVEIRSRVPGVEVTSRGGYFAPER